MYKMKLTEIWNLICAREFGKVQLTFSFKLGFNFQPKLRSAQFQSKKHGNGPYKALTSPSIFLNLLGESDRLQSAPSL